MKKREKVFLLSFIFVVLAVITVILYMNELDIYMIFFATLTGIMLIVVLICAFENKDEKSIYLSSLKRFLKTYDSVLIDSENLPELRGKNILMVTNASDLIDAQVELRKPIYYKRDLDSCSFVLIDNKEACVYVMKVNESVVSPIEIRIDELLKESEQLKTNKKSLLENIDRTTIIKLDNMKSYKISPVRDGVKPEEKNKSFMERLRKDFLPKLKDK